MCASIAPVTFSGRRIIIENTSTTQPKRSEETTTERSKREALEGIKDKLGSYCPSFRHEILSKALEETQLIIDAAEKLKGMEEKVRKIYKHLDIKDRATIAVLLELVGVESMSVGVEYGPDIYMEIRRDRKAVVDAVDTYPDDKDIALLCEVYRLSRIVNNEGETQEDEV